MEAMESMEENDSWKAVETVDSSTAFAENDDVSLGGSVTSFHSAIAEVIGDSPDKKSVESGINLATPATAPKDEMDEEIIALKTELNAVQTEYQKIVNTNIELSDDNRAKEQKIRSKEEILKVFIAKTNAEIDQLDIEANIKISQQEYDLTMKMGKITQLRNEQDRLYQLENSNAILKQSIEKIIDQMKTKSQEHALEMHHMNKAMLEARKKMESQFRIDLSKQDTYYQMKAFDELSESHKRAMLQNAKLKDEVILQGVGMANLGIRYKKQKAQSNVLTKELNGLYKKAKMLRDKLAKLATIKRQQVNDYNDLVSKHQKVCDDLALLQKKSSVLPSISSIEKEHVDCKYKIEQVKSAIETWEARQTLLQDVYLRLKPLDESEMSGKYSKLLFPLKPIVLSNKESTVTPTVSEIQSIIESSKHLTKALKRLKGKEAVLMTSDKSKKKTGASLLNAKAKSSEDEKQNMAAWVVFEIIRIFQETGAVKTVTVVPDDTTTSATTAGEAGPADADSGDAANEQEWDAMFDPQNSYFNSTKKLHELGVNETDWFKPLRVPRKLPPSAFATDTFITSGLQLASTIEDKDVKVQVHDYSMAPPIATSTVTKKPEVTGNSSLSLSKSISVDTIIDMTAKTRPKTADPILASNKSLKGLMRAESEAKIQATLQKLKLKKY